MSKAMFLAASAAAAAIASSASADVIAQWTFESSVPTTAGPHAAEGGLLAASSFATGFHATSTTYSNPVGNGSAESFSSNGWSVGDYYQFTTSSTGYDSITIKWDQTRSGTGPSAFALFASADSFATSTLLSTYTVDEVTWSSGTYQPGSSFAPVAAGAGFANQATLSFRLVAQAAPGASGGTNRIDNIVIEGTAVPAPASAALVGLAGLVAARRRRA